MLAPLLLEFLLMRLSQLLLALTEPNTVVMLLQLLLLVAVGLDKLKNTGKVIQPEFLIEVNQRILRNVLFERRA